MLSVKFETAARIFFDFLLSLFCQSVGGQLLFPPYVFSRQEGKKLGKVSFSWLLSAMLEVERKSVAGVTNLTIPISDT